MVQWPRIQTPKAGGPGLIPGQRTTQGEPLPEPLKLYLSLPMFEIYVNGYIVCIVFVWPLAQHCICEG